MSRARTMETMAIEQLILAFEKGEHNGGSVEWEDLQLAYQLAIDVRPAMARRIRRELDRQAFEGACGLDYSPESGKCDFRHSPYTGRTHCRHCGSERR